jgi:ribosomal protein S18 acetylase RimI-like enzyme
MRLLNLKRSTYSCGVYAGYQFLLCWLSISFVLVLNLLGVIVFILALAVLPAYQGIGMGKSLMNDLLENRKAFKPSLLETKPTTIAVQTLENVKDFFEKLGFEKVQDGDPLASSFNQKSTLPDGNRLWLTLPI